MLVYLYFLSGAIVPYLIWRSPLPGDISFWPHYAILLLTLYVGGDHVLRTVTDPLPESGSPRDPTLVMLRGARALVGGIFLGTIYVIAPPLYL